MADDVIVEHLLIPGSLEALELVHEWTNRLMERARVPENLQHNILLALSECVTNAIRHGCKEDRDKKVKLECRATDHAIVFRIRDKGKGFRLEAVPDPTEGPFLFRAGGRGVFLLKHLTSQAHFDTSPDGTCVSFWFEW